MDSEKDSEEDIDNIDAAAMISMPLVHRSVQDGDGHGNTDWKCQYLGSAAHDILPAGSRRAVQDYAPQAGVLDRWDYAGNHDRQPALAVERGVVRSEPGAAAAA